jgi:dihydroneopterin aldolase
VACPLLTRVSLNLIESLLRASLKAAVARFVSCNQLAVTMRKPCAVSRRST